MMPNHFELGLYTFAELTPHPRTGELFGTKVAPVVRAEIARRNG